MTSRWTEDVAIESWLGGGILWDLKLFCGGGLCESGRLVDGLAGKRRRVSSRGLPLTRLNFLLDASARDSRSISHNSEL